MTLKISTTFFSIPEVKREKMFLKTNGKENTRSSAKKVFIA